MRVSGRFCSAKAQAHLDRLQVGCLLREIGLCQRMRGEPLSGEAKLEAAPVNVAVRAGEGGRLFGSVTVAEIASAISATAGEDVDKRTIVVGNTIKSLGAHEVSVKLHDGVSATVSLNVVPA